MAIKPLLSSPVIILPSIVLRTIQTSQWSPCRGQLTRTCDCWTLSLLSSLALIKSMNDPVFVFVF